MATIDTCLTWMEKSREVIHAKPPEEFCLQLVMNNLGKVSCSLLLALQPIARLRPEGDPREPAHWIVVSWEILARRKGAGDYFPFPFYASLTSLQRCDFTKVCAGLSEYLQKHKIAATFNVQLCDHQSIFEEIKIEDVSYELADFAANADGSLRLHPEKKLSSFRDYSKSLDRDE